MFQRPWGTGRKVCMASSVILGVTGCFVRGDRKEAGLTEAVSS